MKKYNIYKGFAIFFSILMLFGIVGIVLTHIIDINVIYSSMPWLVEFMHKIGIMDPEAARHVVSIYNGVVYLFVFWFTCLAFRHATKAFKHIKGTRAQMAQVYITTDEDIKALKKRQHIKHAEDKKMKSHEEKLAKRVALKAKRRAEKAAKEAEKLAKEQAKEVKKELAEVKKEVVDKKVEKTSKKIDDILGSM